MNPESWPPRGNEHRAAPISPHNGGRYGQLQAGLAGRLVPKNKHKEYNMPPRQCPESKRHTMSAEIELIKSL
jgi:hypothetical protein